MASVGAVKRHTYDQHRVRRAMTGEWEQRVKRAEYDRDIWKRRAERAESLLQSHMGNDALTDSDSDLATLGESH